MPKNLKYQIQNIIKDNSLNLFPVTWQDRNSSLINALKIEKNVMFLILTLNYLCCINEYHFWINYFC